MGERHCAKSVQIRSFFWSLFGHFLLSKNNIVPASQEQVAMI